MQKDYLNDLEEHQISSEKKFSGNLLHVYSDTVRLPDDNEAVREWIDHQGAAAVIPVFEDQTTLLVEQYRYPVRKVMLEIPAGKRDGGEPYAETARRELDEETGWQAGKLEDLGGAFPVIGYSNEWIHFFLASDLSPGIAEQEDDEFLRIKRIPFLDAMELVYNGTIEDMKTIVGLQRAYRILFGRST